MWVESDPPPTEGADICAVLRKTTIWVLALLETGDFEKVDFCRTPPFGNRYLEIWAFPCSIGAPLRPFSRFRAKSHILGFLSRVFGGGGGKKSILGKPRDGFAAESDPPPKNTPGFSLHE